MFVGVWENVIAINTASKTTIVGAPQLIGIHLCSHNIALVNQCAQKKTGV